MGEGTEETTEGGYRNVIDRFEITALAGEFTDAVMVKDFDRLGALFTEDGELRIPAADIAFIGRDAVREGIERLQGNWEFYVQNIHPGSIVLEGDTATGRSYLTEMGRFHDGTSNQNTGIYHDEYRRTPDGWRFTSRVYEPRYLDFSPLPGGPPTDEAIIHVAREAARQAVR